MARSKKCALCTNQADYHDGVNDQYLCNRHLQERFKALYRPPVTTIPKKIYTLLTLDTCYDQHRELHTFSSKAKALEHVYTVFGKKAQEDIESMSSYSWSDSTSEDDPDNMSIELFETDLL